MIGAFLIRCRRHLAWLLGPPIPPVKPLSAADFALQTQRIVAALSSLHSQAVLQNQVVLELSERVALLGPGAVVGDPAVADLLAQLKEPRLESVPQPAQVAA